MSWVRPRTSPLSFIGAISALSCHLLLDAWDAGDGVVRRETLATLFSDIHVGQGRVVGYAPRPDRQSRVTRLMDTISWNCLSVWAVMDLNQRPPRCKRGALAS